MANTQLDILGRIIDDMPTVVARHFVTLTFQPSDHARMDELAAKARDGALSTVEAQELDEYRRAASVLALLHSKARIALRRAGQAI